MTKKKDLTFWEALSKKNISYFGDEDKDNIPNFMDCRPYDPKKDGFFGRAINVLSRGKYGQNREDFEAEKTLKRVEQKRQLEYKIDKQKAENALIKQKLDLQKLKAKEQDLIRKQRLQAQLYPQPSTAQEVASIIFGIPLQKPQFTKPGYHIEYEGPKLPKGYKWEKNPKDNNFICPRCGAHMIIMPGFMGQPVLSCPRCGLSFN